MLPSRRPFGRWTVCAVIIVDRGASVIARHQILFRRDKRIVIAAKLKSVAGGSSHPACTIVGQQKRAAFLPNASQSAACWSTEAKERKMKEFHEPAKDEDGQPTPPIRDQVPESTF